MSLSVWIINPYGTLPAEPWATYRSTMLAEHLADRGHEVTQFISNFEHRSKTYRPAAPGGIQVRKGYRIELVPSTGYDAHVSLARIRYERRFASNLVALTAGLARPDVIVLAEPSIFYYDILLETVLLTARRGLVIDIIDIWPELFALVLPRPVRPVSGALLGPLYAWRRRLLRHADAIVAVAEDYLKVVEGVVDSAVPRAVVYWSYDDRRDPAGETLQPGSPVGRLLEARRPGEVWALYAGTLGENYDIPSILAVGRTLPAALRHDLRLKIVIAGDGPLADACREASGDDLVFLGRLGRAEMAVLHQHADFALSTYRGESTVAMPIKAFDYLRFGLPIVNSLGRDLGRLVTEREVGINYGPGSVPALAAAIKRLARDPALRARLSANARRLALEFSPAVQYGRFAELVEGLGQPPAG